MNLKNKTPTFTGYKLDKQYSFQGLQLSIENKKGTTREWKNRNGKTGKTKMQYDYGYIRRTLGNDKDHIDCYVGPNKEAKQVYVIHQNVNGKFDEDKVMLGFNSTKEAKVAYLKHYDDPSFFGSMDTIPMDKFKDKVIGKRVNRIKKATGSKVHTFTIEDAKDLGMKIGINWEHVHFGADDFLRGIDVETEHEGDPQTDVISSTSDLGKIALAHLKEDPKYYTKLAVMESKKSMISMLFQYLIKARILEEKQKTGVQKRHKTAVEQESTEAKGKPQAKGHVSSATPATMRPSSIGRTIPWRPETRFVEHPERRRPPSVTPRRGSKKYSAVQDSRATRTDKQYTIAQSHSIYSGKRSSLGKDAVAMHIRGVKKYRKSELKESLINILKKAFEGNNGTK